MLYFQNFHHVSIFLHVWDLYTNHIFVCLLSDIALGPMDGKSTESSYFDVSGALEIWKPYDILIHL